MHAESRSSEDMVVVRKGAPNAAPLKGAARVAAASRDAREGQEDRGVARSGRSLGVPSSTKDGATTQGPRAQETETGQGLSSWQGPWQGAQG